ncbi:helix-turn-helix transcriptional regulator [Pseudoduganella sp. UC29_71]|uniref:S24 family peptidase n=1 Tax=Pseudoduganella sp. UC29_71 TaxID=3350174 RepID=UPI00367011FC
MEPDQRRAPLAREQAKNLDLHLVPGLRNRLIAELAARDIPAHQHASYLSRLTGRAVQTVARWIDADQPGLPDLASLAVLALQLNVDAHWLLGLLQHRLDCPYDRLPRPLLAELYPDGPPSADWVGALLPKIGATSAGRAGIMQGTEMAPLIPDGTPFFYDDSQRRVSCNGIYLLAYNGHTLVRHVERRIGEGLLLRCENTSYADSLLKDADGADAKLTVLGRVLLVVRVSAV